MDRILGRRYPRPRILCDHNMRSRADQPLRLRRTLTIPTADKPRASHTATLAGSGIANVRNCHRIGVICSSASFSLPHAKMIPSVIPAGPVHPPMGAHASRVRGKTSGNREVLDVVEGLPNVVPRSKGAGAFAAPVLCRAKHMHLLAKRDGHCIAVIHVIVVRNCYVEVGSDRRVGSAGLTKS